MLRESLFTNILSVFTLHYQNDNFQKYLMNIKKHFLSNC